MEELFKSRSSLGRKTPSGRSKQTVHAKFELSEDALEARERLSEFWGVTQKEVAEMAAQLTVSFLEDEDEKVRRWFAENASEQPGELTRKSHVVSQEAKLFLKKIAGDFDLTRDQSFDASLRLAHTVVKFLGEAQLGRHEEQLPHLRDLLSQVESVEAELMGKATAVDPLKPALSSLREQLEAIVDDVEEELESGIPLAHDHEFN